jgi:inner membrane protein
VTWKSHIAIATAVTIPFNPSALGVAILGSTAPDWSEWVLKFFSVNIQHRGATHYLIIPLSIIIFSFIFGDILMKLEELIFWFGIGYFTHWFADSLTISGVPISPWDTSRVHFFGGKLKTGDMLEYIISFSLLAMSVTVAKPMIETVYSFGIGDEYKNSFKVFSMDYQDLKDKNIIDAKELLEKRFKFF